MEDRKFICEFCNSVLKDEHILKMHQKTVKKCLIAQGKLEEITKEYICICGGKKISRKKLQEHQQTCIKYLLSQKDLEYNNILKEKDIEISFLNAKIVNLEIENENKQKKIKEYEDKIFEIAKQPKNIKQTNNTNKTSKKLKPFNRNFEQILEIYIENNLTQEHVMQGQKGAAEIVIECLNTLDDSDYVISDLNRCIFKYVNSDGIETKDIKAKKLAKLCKSQLLKKYENILNEYESINQDLLNKDEQLQFYISEIKRIEKQVEKDTARLVLASCIQEKTEIRNNLTLMRNTLNDTKKLRNEIEESINNLEQQYDYETYNKLKKGVNSIEIIDKDSNKFGTCILSLIC